MALSAFLGVAKLLKDMTSSGNNLNASNLTDLIGSFSGSKKRSPRAKGNSPLANKTSTLGKKFVK